MLQEYKDKIVFMSNTRVVCYCPWSLLLILQWLRQFMFSAWCYIYIYY